MPWVVVGFDAEVLSVRSGGGSPAGTGLPTAGSGGMVEVTPVEGFRGTTRMTYAHPDDLARTATVEVVVTGNAPPQVGEDSLGVDVGVATTIPAVQLLGNDTDPDGGLPLRVVQVSGMTAGQAWLTADADQVVVVADRVGEAEFSYVVADRDGGIGRGRVVVTVRGGQTTPPSPPPTSPPPAGPPTVAPPQAPPDIAPVVTASSSGKVYFAYKSVRLSKAEKRKLRRMLAQIPDGATVVLTRSVGVVKSKGATGADKRRALKRARVVRDYLLTQGLTGPVQVSNGGRTTGKSAKARRVDVTITYTLRQ